MEVTFLTWYIKNNFKTLELLPSLIANPDSNYYVILINECKGIPNEEFLQKLKKNRSCEYSNSSTELSEASNIKIFTNSRRKEFNFINYMSKFDSNLKFHYVFSRV